MLLLGIALLTLSLLSGVFAALAWNAPPVYEAPQVLLLLDPQLNNNDLDDIYLQVRNWPEVAQLQFALNAHDLGVPLDDAITDRSPSILIHLSDSAEAQTLIERSGVIGGVQQAIPFSSGNSSAVDQSQLVKPILLTVFVVSLLASFFALTGGVGQLVQTWKGELELLRLSGIPRRSIITSFAWLGILSGAVGALLSTVLIYATASWAQTPSSLFQQYVPIFIDGERLFGFTLAAVIIGLLIGVLSGAWGTRYRETI